MGVTAIRSIANLHTSASYLVQNRENPGDTPGPDGGLAVPPNKTVRVNIWIPWCDDETWFGFGKNILFEALGTANVQVAPDSFTIWQRGDYVYYSTDDTFASGMLVPGKSVVDGERSVEITGSERLKSGIKFY